MGMNWREEYTKSLTASLVIFTLTVDHLTREGQKHKDKSK
jgi:hypothetical protein